MVSLRHHPITVRHHLTTLFQTICDRPKLSAMWACRARDKAGMGPHRKTVAVSLSGNESPTILLTCLHVDCFIVYWRSSISSPLSAVYTSFFTPYSLNHGFTASFIGFWSTKYTRYCFVALSCSRFNSSFYLSLLLLQSLSSASTFSSDT
jgi:hypothetical protein